jgi:hypoxanthine phosphoribosyltransferase
MHPDGERILFSEEQILARVAELGTEISHDYKDKELLVIGILKGAIIFLSDLVRRIRVPLYYDFMAVSSYGASTVSSGVVRILKDLNQSIENRHVLIVEDIVDTGLTLNYLVDNLKARGPASLKVCTLLDKPSSREVPVKIDYNGFTVPNEFIVGYGLDYDGRYRNFPYIMVLSRRVYEGGN